MLNSSFNKLIKSLLDIPNSFANSYTLTFDKAFTPETFYEPFHNCSNLFAIELSFTPITFNPSFPNA